MEPVKKYLHSKNWAVGFKQQASKEEVLSDVFKNDL